MARIRSLKPSFWTDEKVIGLTRDARLLCIGMISHADDDGRLLATVTKLAGDIFPADELKPGQLLKWRTEIADAGLIQIYKVGAVEYASFRQWKKHQRISKPQPSSLPGPDRDSAAVRNASTPERGTGASSESENEPGIGSRKGNNDQTERGSRAKKRSRNGLDADSSDGIRGDMGSEAQPQRASPAVITAGPSTQAASDSAAERGMGRDPERTSRADPPTSRRQEGRQETGVPPSAGDETPPRPRPVAHPAAPEPHVTAQILVGEWLDQVPKRPPGNVIGQISKQLKAMLDERISPDDVRRGLAEWARKGLHPSTLPSVVNEVMNRGHTAVADRRQQATNDMFDRAMQRATAREEGR